MGFQSQFWSNMEWQFSSWSREKYVVFPSIPQPLLFCCCALKILFLTPVTLTIKISHYCVNEPTTWPLHYDTIVSFFLSIVNLSYQNFFLVNHNSLLHYSLTVHICVHYYKFHHTC
jgi:hypothetical protein